jgi:tetratricopeptide (TPR) repeat protein
MATAATIGPVEILRVELERLYDLDALQTLSRDLLGLDPGDVAAEANRPAFARALAERSVRDDLHEALADAIVLTDRSAEVRLRPVYDGRAADDLAVGQMVVGYKILKKTHDEGFGTVYLAVGPENHQATFKVMREGRARDRRALQRFLLAQRALRQVHNPAVQRIVAAGMLPDGRPYVAAEHIDGQLLSARIGRAGAMHINEARGVFQSVCEGLDAVHAAGLAHGDLRTDHVVLVRRDGGLGAVLVDFGIDRLGSARHGAQDAASFLVLLGGARGLAPERARFGTAADAKSDVYGLGALAFEVLTGKPPFAATSLADLVVAHITQEPEAPSKVAPRGWVTKEVDAVVLKALAKDPEARYASAGAFLAALFEASKAKRGNEVGKDEFAARKAALAEAPTDDDKALALEAAGGNGVTWAEVAAAITEVADGADDAGAKKALRFRAARVLEAEVKDLPAAKAAYEAIAAMEGGDELAAARAKEIRRATANAEERAEIYLEDIETEALATEKARLWAELGRHYERELSDSENALVAFTEAVSASPADDDLAAEIARLVGDDAAKWNEVTAQVSEAAKGRESAEQVALYLRAGRWYLDRVKRTDYALACFNQAITANPGSDEALEGAAAIYRKAQQWAELVGTLLKRADAQAQAARARDLRAEAADLLESKLDERTKSRELAEKVVAEDAAHDTATQVLERLLLRAEDWAGVAKLLEHKAEAQSGEKRAETYCEIAEVYEDRRSDVLTALEWYEKALTADGRNMAALKGLERLYAREGKSEGLLKVLEAQVDAVATPRQKVELHNRIGALVEEEFVDHARAATAFEAALAIDPANDLALRGLGRLFRVLGRWEELASLLDRHATLVDDAAKKAELLVSAGRLFLDPIGSVERAGRCFERALEVEPGNGAALELNARVAGLQGDVRSATEAYEKLAAAAKTPTEKVEVLLKLAKLLEDKGDRDGAIDRYKQALDVDPDSASATARLRELYASRGDSQGAIELLQREIEAAEGSNQRASLWAQVARIYRDRVKDHAKARDAAEKSVLLDATNEDAAVMLGELHFDAGQWADAAKHLAGRAGRAKELGRDEGLGLALKYGEALAKSGDAAKALEAFRAAAEVAPDDREALLAVAKATYAAEAWGEAKTRYEALLQVHRGDLDEATRAAALYELADATRRGGDNAAAIASLTEATDLAPTSARTFELLATLHGAEGRWDEVVRAKRRLLELAETDAQRFTLHMELGELLATRLGDKARAARSFVAALELRPSERRILMRLMQLYSDEKDWGRLVEIILKFADLVDDKAQLSRYYATAAQLCEIHLNRPEEAIDYYEQALEHDPSHAAALEGLAALRGAKKDWTGLEQSYRKVLARLGEGASASAKAKLYALLGALYEKELKQPAEAVTAYERAQELCPAEQDHGEKLAELYLTDTKRFFDRAVTTHRALLVKNPLRVESMHALRRAFTEARKPDEAWCMCQALVSVKGAEPEEESFFKKFRTDRPAAAQEKMNEERWRLDLAHASLDPLLTSVFATILPAVLKSRGVPLADYGLSDKALIDPATDDGQMAQTIHYAAGVLGLKTPPVYALPSDDSGLNLVLSQDPGLYLGASALAGGPTKALAFLAGVRLSYFRAGHFVRQIVATGTGLRAWLFAAMRAVQPTFPVGDELMGPVNENLAAIKAHLQGAAMEQLASLVTKLIASDLSLDLKRWTIAVDLTADRAGFVLANDLAVALAVIKATPDEQAAVPQADRVRELRAYAVSEEYLRLRQRLGIAIGVAG